MSESGVFQAMNKVHAEIAAVGISKDKENKQQGFKFRGIDDVYNVISPMLAKHGLLILPRILTRDVVERTTAKGGQLFFVTVEGEFDFVCTADGSKHTVRTFGEAMDSGDKATNKAMSAAYKYAVFMSFAIPTEGDNDADAHDGEVRQSLTDGGKADLLAGLDSASTVDELRAAYETGKKLAEMAGDVSFFKVFAAKKNERLAELQK